MAGVEAAALDALAELLLAAGAGLPRAEAARRLGWPPERVDTTAAGLAALGAEIELDPNGLALRLAEPLARASFAAALAGVPDLAVEVCRVCESTNERARPGRGWRLCLSEAQTRGRGRRGAAWQQPFGSGLTMSLGAPLAAPGPGGLAIALAVAVAEVLAAAGYPGIRLKWPNDLYAGGGKLGGLLVEAHGGPAPGLVVGLGLNVRAAPRLPARATAALADLGPAPSRNCLAARVAEAMIAALARFAEAGFAPFAEGFAARDMLAGRRVGLSSGTAAWSGVARGVSGAGALMVETADGRLECVGADATVTTWREP